MKRAMLLSSYRGGTAKIVDGKMKLAVLVVLPVHVCAGATTFARDVAPILRKHCEGCHRPGQIGPFPLTTYEEARAFRTEIKRVTQTRRMPPWSAVPGHGDFRNERRLSDTEIATIAAWVDGGAKRGKKKDLPPPAVYSDDWAFGAPDLVLTAPGEYELSGNGIDEYRCFVIPSGLAGPRFIQALEVRPGNRKIVHHVRNFADLTGQARKLDAADTRPGFDCSLAMAAPYKRIGIGGWAPGIVPERSADDIGVFLPARADIVMEVHYHRNGLRQKDRSSLGLWFHKSRPPHVQRSMPVANLGIRIPAGASRHEERASWTVAKPILATSITPHMHLLGVEMRVTATFPDGRKEDLVWAKPYDFQWQTTYRFREKIRLPRGTQIEAVAVYDNSESNPGNPNKPLKEVRWGEGTNEEMLVAFLGYIDEPVEPLGNTRP